METLVLLPLCIIWIPMEPQISMLQPFKLLEISFRTMIGTAPIYFWNKKYMEGLGGGGNKNVKNQNVSVAI